MSIVAQRIEARVGSGIKSVATQYEKEQNQDVYLADAKVVSDFNFRYTGTYLISCRQGKADTSVTHPRVRSWLKNKLQYGNPKQRVAAAKRIGNIGGPCELWTVPALIRASKDAFPKVRIAAAHALGQINGKGLIDVAKLLKDKDVKVRIAAASALTRFNYGRARQVSFLAAALIVSKNKVERDALVDQLHLIVIDHPKKGSIPPRDYDYKKAHVRRDVAKSRVAVKLLQKSIPMIIRVLTHGKSARDAAELLGVLGDGRSIVPLIKALDYRPGDIHAIPSLYGSVSVRDAASKALIKIGRPAIPHLKKYAKSNNLLIRKAVTSILKKIKASTSSPKRK